MKVKNISDYILAGIGTDGKYYEVMPGDESEVCGGLVKWQGWVAKGLVESPQKAKPVKKTEKKKEKKEKKEDFLDDLDTVY